MLEKNRLNHKFGKRVKLARKSAALNMIQDNIPH